MNAEQFKEILTKLDACAKACEWADGKDWREVYATCHHADWLLWLHERTAPNKRRLRTLAVGHCANAVRHLMTDPRSTAAVDAAIAYGEGRIGDDELGYARDAARAAAWAAEGAAEGDAAWGAARAAEGTAAWDAALKDMADIVRQYIPIESFNLNIYNYD